MNRAPLLTMLLLGIVLPLQAASPGREARCAGAHPIHRNLPFSESARPAEEPIRWAPHLKTSEQSLRRETRRFVPSQRQPTLHWI